MAVFEYRQAEEIRDAFARHGARYLFLGKSGATMMNSVSLPGNPFIPRSLPYGAPAKSHPITCYRPESSGG